MEPAVSRDRWPEYRCGIGFHAVDIGKIKTEGHRMTQVIGFQIDYAIGMILQVDRPWQGENKLGPAVGIHRGINNFQAFIRLGKCKCAAI